MPTEPPGKPTWNSARRTESQSCAAAPAEGTVLQGPGCLNYSLVLRMDRDPQLQGITGTNAYILGRHQAALSGLVGQAVELQGHTDLAIDGLKFCGNAQRRKRHCLIFHGCFLLQADIGLIERTLPMPSQQPGYRANRSHTQFLRNLGVAGAEVQSALIEAWSALQPFTAVPFERITRLAEEKYATEAWNGKF